MSDPPGSFLVALKIVDGDCFPSTHHLLTIGYVSPIGSTEADRAASGVRRLKTPYHSTMTDEREGDLNLMSYENVYRLTTKEVVYCKILVMLEFMNVNIILDVDVVLRKLSLGKRFYVATVSY